MEDQKRRVVAAFDLASDTYDEPALKCFDLHAVALVREAQVHGGAQVLDVATGTGKVAFAAARAVGPKGRIVGVDLSEGMLAQARRTAGGLPVEFRLIPREVGLSIMYSFWGAPLLEAVGEDKIPLPAPRIRSTCGRGSGQMPG